MAKRNQVTADLRISANAQLKNSQSFIKELEKITSGFDFGNKINNQLEIAKGQLKEYNKVLSKVQNKSVVSDEELKDIVKAGKEIAILKKKTESLYKNLNGGDLKKYSREYIAETKRIEQTVAKIKQDYADKTGKNFDKELANYDKLLDKNKELKKQREQLAKSGVEELVTKQIEQTTQKLEQQKKKLEEIKALREQSSKIYSNTLNQEAAKRGYKDYNDLNSRKVLNENQIKKNIGTNIYKQEKQELVAISKELKNIESIKDNVEVQNKKAISLAAKYNIENVKDLNTFKAQLKIRQDLLNTYKNDKSKLALRNQELITEELRKQEKIKNDKNEVKTIAKNVELAAIEKGGYASKASLSASYAATAKTVNNLNSQLTEDGIATITNNATERIASILQQIDIDIKNSNKELNDINETNSKVATQTERAADEQDIKQSTSEIKKDNSNIKKTITGFKTPLEKVENNTGEDGTINKFTFKDNTRIQDYLSKDLKEQKMLDTASESISMIENSDERDSIIGKGIINKNRFEHLKEYVTEAKELLELKTTGIIEEEDLKRLDKYEDKIQNIFTLYKSNITDRRQKYFLESANNEDLILEGIDYNKTVKPIRKSLSNFQKYYHNVITSNGTVKDKKNTKNENKNLKETSDDVDTVAEKIAKAAEQSSYLGSTFDDIKNKIGYFLSLNYVFDQMTRKINEAINSTKEMDRDMTQIGLVLGKTSGQVWKNFDTYSKMADRLNTTTSQVTNSMKLFYQQGLNTTEVNKMVEASAIAAALGESTMAEASETLTSIINSYNLSAKDAMTVTDKISQIAIVSAADFGELSTAIEKVASSAASAGLDLDHMMGYLAKMIETTREAPTNIGTALKTIVANFTQFKEDPTELTEEGTEINKVDKALKSVGISLTNTNGEVRDLSDVLDELGGIWDTLNRNQKSYLATAIAGTRQQSRFYALMNDYERTLQLVAEGSNSAGKAQQQFALYSNSLEASTQRLNNEWEKFFNQITSGNGLMKNFNDFLTSTMKIINNVGPIGTALGLIGFVSQLRKSINNISSFNKGIEEIQDKKEVFKSIMSAESDIKKYKENKTLSKEQKKNGINIIRNNNKQTLVDNGFTAQASKEWDTRKILKYKEAIKDINNQLALQPNLFKKIGLHKDKTINGLKLKFIAAKNAVQQFAKGLAIAGAQMFALYIAGEVFKGIKQIIDANSQSAEKFAEKAEKAAESAETIKGLRDEYEELASKVNKTAEEEERLKEITNEVTQVSTELGNALSTNVNAFKENVDIMDDYIARQKEIAGQNSILSTLKAGKENNNWWNKTIRWFGGYKKDEEDTGTAKTLYSEIDNGAIQKYNLDSQRQSILSNYATELFNKLEQQNKTADDWYKGLEDYKNKVAAMAQSLQQLDSTALKIYSSLQVDFNNQELTYKELEDRVKNANIDENIKNNYLKSIQDARFSSVGAITNKTGIDYSTALSIVDSLSRADLTKIFDPDNLDILTETEQKQYWKAITELFTDEKLKNEVIKAIKENGVDGLTDIINNLDNSTIGYLDIVKEVTNGLVTLETTVENAKKAFEKLNTLLNDNVWTGRDLSQMDIISGLLDGTYNIQDIKTIGNGNILRLDFTTMLNKLEAQYAELEKPFEEQVKNLQDQIDYYSNYGDNLVKDAQEKLELQQTEVDKAQEEYDKEIANKKTNDEYRQQNETDAQAEYDNWANNGAWWNMLPVIGQGIYFGGLIDKNNNLKDVQKDNETNRVSDEAALQQKKLTLNEEQAKYNEINNELQIALDLKNLINATDEEIKNKAKENVDTYIEQNKQGREWVSILNDAGEEVGKIDSSRWDKGNFINQDKSNGITEEQARELKNGNEGDTNNIKFYEDEEEQLKETKKAAQDYANAQINAAKDIQTGYTKTLSAIQAIKKKSLEYQETYKAVFESFSSAGQVYGELEKVANAYSLCNKGAEGYFDVAQAIANDPSLIDALDMESQYLELDKQKVVELGKTKVQTQIDELKTKLEGTNAIIGLIQAQIDAGNAETVAEATNLDDKADIIASAIAYNKDYTNSNQESTDTEKENLEISVQNWTDWQEAIIKLMQNVENQRAALAKRIADGETAAGSTSTANLTGITVNYSGKGAKTADEIKKTNKDEYDKLLDTIKTSDTSKLQEMLKSYQKQKTILEKSINSLNKYKDNMASNLANISGGGGGSKDKFDAMVEKLEHFYNYLRQIEALEAKINKIREKRNLIDATQNYYIKDLAEENKLLKEQASLYGRYINDEVSYLADLRSQLAAAYGDWVYFNDEGVVQVRQTEFNINSEAEQERYETFSELLNEYQNEYNTMLENQNKLYSIQATIVENINNSYDKVLQKLNDVTERLEYINSISEHRVNMEFGSIKKLKIMNDQIKTTADMLLYAQKSVNELEGDFNQLSKIVEESAFKSLLTWDETLQKYFVNNDALNNDNIRKQFESQGYNWEEIVTWVNATAGASQKITDSMKEANEQLMSAREALKDLLDERLSTIDEIFDKATEEINKFYDIYEKKISSLGTENDLFGTKSENLEKQFDYLVTTAQHAKALLNDLKENNQSILDTLMKDYGQYVDMIDGVAYINKVAIEESNTLTEGQKADLLQLYQLYYDSKDQIDEVNDKFYDYISQIKEMEETKRDAVIDLKNQLYQELLRIDQKEIDDLSEKYQKMNQLDSEYYSKLQQRINDARNARSRLQEQQNLTQMQNRLATLQQDNSGQYNSEMIELQKQINEQLQNQADQNVDLELERIAREQEQRQEDREMQITQMENLLTFKDENGIYWQETQDIIENGNASVIGKLMESEEIQKMSKEEQAKQFESLEGQVETANADFTSIYQDEMGWQTSDIRQGLKDFVEAPLDKIPGEISSNASEIKGQIQNATSTFIKTMNVLFRLLNEAQGKTEAGGWTTGILDDKGDYTAPTKKPDPAPATPVAPAAPPQSKPSLAKGSYVQVKSGTKWYYDSYGTNPSGRARSGTIKYINTKGSHPYNIEGLGWIKKTDIVGYNKGGYVDYTGIAAVHGKAGKPEAFLNAKQTALFETLRDALAKVPTIRTKEENNNNENITIENFTIDVKELADTDSIDKVVKTVKDSIYRDATSGNNMKINRRR